MFGIITRGFIEKVHDAFDELEYHVNEDLSFDDFYEKANYALNHAKDLIDAINVVRMIHFCFDEWDKIEKIFTSHLNKWNEYSWEGSSMISYCNDDEAAGVYCITNGISKNYKDIHYGSIAFENEIYMFDHKYGEIRVCKDSSYYLKYSKMSSTKMKLFDGNDDCIANIVLSDKMEIFLERNKTPYEIVLQDGYIEIFSKEYIDSLADTDIIEREHVLADIEWDILEKDSEQGVARLIIYEDFEDIDVPILFAASTFLLYKSYMTALKATTTAMVTSRNALIANRNAMIYRNTWRRK